MRRATFCVLALLAGCDDMIQQPKRNAYREATVGPGPVPTRTIAFEAPSQARPALTPALLARGQGVVRAFCTECHGEVGQANGMIVQRGFSPPPSYHIPRLREAPDQHLFDVISNGWGAMYSFAARVRPEDRWAAVAYMRALQRSQDSRMADLTPDERAALP